MSELACDSSIVYLSFHFENFRTHRVSPNENILGYVALKREATKKPQK